MPVLQPAAMKVIRKSCMSQLVLSLAMSGMATTAIADPVPMPSTSGPLSDDPNPLSLDAGPLGKVYITGALTGLAFWQSNPVLGDRDSRIDISNGEVFVQKTDGWLQFFAQAGAYSLPSLGTEYIKASDLPDKTYGVVPQGFVKVVLSDSFSVEAGKLPTLIGDEYTFTFENMNIERGLLWNQEPAVSRGIQANYATGPLTLALSFNDGFYSNVYNWVSGSAAYTIDSSNSVALVGGGNLGRTYSSSFATPLAQNNGDIFNLIYTHTSGPWTISPYLQYTSVPSDATLGIAHSASTYGAAILASYAFNDNWKLGGRAEYHQVHRHLRERRAKPTLWSRQPCLVAHRHAHLPEGHLLRPRRRLLHGHRQFGRGIRVRQGF
jgi:hypothetical protein